jgi:hypothetical protein
MTMTTSIDPTAIAMAAFVPLLVPSGDGDPDTSAAKTKKQKKQDAIEISRE